MIVCLITRNIYRCHHRMRKEISQSRRLFFLDENVPIEIVFELALRRFSCPWHRHSHPIDKHTHSLSPTV